MSRSVAPREDSCELPPVTCWPLIGAACSIVVVGVCAAVVLFVGDWLRPLFPRTEESVARSTESDIPAANIERAPDTPPSLPEAGTSRVVVKRHTGNEYVPLPPTTPVEQPEWKAEIRLQGKARATRTNHLLAQALRPVPKSEEALLRSLWSTSREVDLEKVEGAGKELLAAGKALVQKREVARQKDDEPVPRLSHAIEDLLKGRDDLRGLPLLLGNACKTDDKQAAVLGELSPTIRRAQELSSAFVRKSSPAYEMPDFYHQGEKMSKYDSNLVSTLIEEMDRSEKRRPRVVGPYEQMVQTEGPLVRKEMVKLFAKVKEKEATQALARRAVFDLARDVREAAVAELKKREWADVQPVLMAAFRHAWAPAADHAAHALVALGEEKAADLVEFLSEEDPEMPRKEEGVYRQRQLVRVNHLRNCLLCHAPSTDEKDFVTGPIPTPGQSLPVVYYSERRRDKLERVRADIVYFRQDFSAVHEVEKPNKWPAQQRFDYLVQDRELSNEEAAKVTEQLKRSTSSRKDAARRALAELMPTDPDRKVPSR